MPKKTKEVLDAQKNIIIDDLYLQNKSLEETDTTKYLINENINYNNINTKINNSIISKINNNEPVDNEILNAQEIAGKIAIAKQADKTLYNYELKLLEAEYRQHIEKNETNLAEDISKKITEKRKQINEIERFEKIAANPKVLTDELHITNTNSVNLKDPRYKENSNNYKNTVAEKSKFFTDRNEINKSFAKLSADYNKLIEGTTDIYDSYVEAKNELDDFLKENRLYGKPEDQINSYLYGYHELNVKYNSLLDSRDYFRQSLFEHTTALSESMDKLSKALVSGYENGVITKDEFDKNLKLMTKMEQINPEVKTFAIDTFPKTVNEFLKQRGLDKEGFTPEEAEGLYISAKMKAEMEKSEYLLNNSEKENTAENGKINNLDEAESQKIAEIGDRISAFTTNRAVALEEIEKNLDKIGGIVDYPDNDIENVKQDNEVYKENISVNLSDADEQNKEEEKRVDAIKVKSEVRHGWRQIIKGKENDDFLKENFDPDLDNIDDEFKNLNSGEQIKDLDELDINFNKNDIIETNMDMSQFKEPEKEQISIDLDEDVDKMEVLKIDNETKKINKINDLNK